MTRFKERRGRLGTLLAVALGAAAIFVLPGLASARDDSSDSSDSATTIQSFDQATGGLVLSLPEGETLSGTVTRRTKIRCEDQRGHRGRHGVRSREAEPGDDHGGRGNEPGDDNGGRGEEEPGDDHGGGDSSGPGSSGSGSEDSHDDNGSGANCTVADLVPGAAVEAVELDFGHGNVRFDEVELEG